MTNIGDYAFYYCTSLTKVIVPDIAAWCGISFGGSYSNPLSHAHHLFCDVETEITDLVIPDGVTSIGNYAFDYCSGLTSITIPNSVTSIGESTFSGCSGLTSITIPNSVTNIFGSAFEGCSSLTSVTLESNALVSASRTSMQSIFGNQVKTYVLGASINAIGNYTFSNCSAMTSITIPNSVTSIGSSAFSECTSLTSINIPNSVTSIGDNAFLWCTSLTSINIPNSVTSLGNSAFWGCSGLTSVTIGNSVTSIGDYAFCYCTGLTSVTIGNSVNSIGGDAFKDCTGLTSITIPNSVTSVGSCAFSGCKLRNVLIRCTTPPRTETSSFSRQTFLHTTLYIPAGCWDVYAYDDAWCEFINIRETATGEEQLSTQQAYTMMDAEAFTYSVYDPVNDRISTISSIGIDENNPNHSWQVIEEGGNRYLYNMGAKKFVEAAANGTFTLTDTPTSINMGNGDKGIILGAQTAKQWALVSNEHMNVEDAIVDGIRSLTPILSEGNEDVYDLSGRKLGSKPTKQGLYIMNGKKVLMK